ncbi:MAG: magnesium chelatase subunit H [Hyphomonadaceae bacterium]|nr:magnesium chelatase subunit H [Hyphomonadaceae bacterium]
MVGKHASAPSVKVVLISLDRQLEAAVSKARARLAQAMPGLTLTFHAAIDWDKNPESLEACKTAIGEADFIVASMLFMNNHIDAILPALKARREHCDAILGCLSAADIVKLTRLDRFRMDKPQSGPIAMLKKLRGSSDKAKAGAQQMKMLRQVPKILKFIPGTAQDVRAYFLSLQYWLAGSDENIENLVRFLVNRYADGARIGYRGELPAEPPIEYPDTGLYHPRLSPPVTTARMKLPLARSQRPSVGLLLMRSYILSKDTGHYDGVIEAMEARGLRVVPAFASGLDSREAIKTYFFKDGEATVDAVVSLTGFSLVGGPAYNDSEAAAEMLSELDVPYLSAQAIEFQSLEEWQSNPQGLSPIESTMMVAIPELDGATGPMVFGARMDDPERPGVLKMCAHEERADMLARRVRKLIELRTTPVADRKVAITLFNFPPNSGAAGTAAHLDVFASLFNTFKTLQRAGYTIECPSSPDALRDAVLGDQIMSDARVHDLVTADEHVARERRLDEIEAQWGPAPGRHQVRGRSIEIRGAQFGNVFVGLQPSFGYEGDPMRLLFEKGFAPTHAFAAYYRWLRERFEADAVLHFGTHGALEFMPGKQVGLSETCWPDYLIDDLPNVYFYAANNPSEAAIAKRRSAATTISYLTPPVVKASIYNELRDLRDEIARWSSTDPSNAALRQSLASDILEQAATLDFEVDQSASSETQIEQLRRKLHDVEEALIPHGLHVAGEAPTPEERIELLSAMAEGQTEQGLSGSAIASLVKDGKAKAIKRHARETKAIQALSEIDDRLADNRELNAIIRALDARFIKPVSGGDLIRNADILPTGRNIHGLDPCRMPTGFALRDGARQTQVLLDRLKTDQGELPQSIAMVLWGADNLKSEGAQLAQVLALLGAEPKMDSYGRLAGAQLLPLEALGRPRIDVVVTLSGIFRDLLPLQSKLIAEAALLAASADEPLEQNFVRAHALAYQAKHDCDLETAALRVFSNAQGAYGSNVNQLIDAGCWDDEAELGNTYAQRKCFAYGCSNAPTAQPELLSSILEDVDLAYQNLESVDLGITTIDHYFDTLGGISQAVKSATGEAPPVYIGDQTSGDECVRTLKEQVALETRTRALNPKWYEGMLRHGYEGVRQIEAHVTNTLGWSATTGQVDPWVYQKIGETFVLDEEMRRKLSDLNPKSSARLAGRLLEASDRAYWQPDEATLEALRKAGDELEDRVEGLNFHEGAAA